MEKDAITLLGFIKSILIGLHDADIIFILLKMMLVGVYSMEQLNDMVEYSALVGDMGDSLKKLYGSIAGDKSQSPASFGADVAVEVRAQAPPLLPAQWHLLITAISNFEETEVCLPDRPSTSTSSTSSSSSSTRKRKADKVNEDDDDDDDDQGSAGAAAAKAPEQSSGKGSRGKGQSEEDAAYEKLLKAHGRRLGRQYDKYCKKGQRLLPAAANRAGLHERQVLMIETFEAMMAAPLAPHAVVPII